MVAVAKITVSLTAGADFFGFEKGMNKKEFLKNKCHQLLFGWECCAGWYKFAHIIELFIMDAFVDLFITLCIIINTAFMAFEQDGMDQQMETTLSYGNYVSSADGDLNCKYTVASIRFS